MGNDFFSDFYNKALEGLGLDTGANAASTIGKVIKDATTKSDNLPAPVPVSTQVMTVIEDNKKTLIVGGVLVAAALLIYIVAGKK